MLTTAAGVLYKTKRSWDMKKELRGWETGCRPEILPFAYYDGSDECSDE